MCFSRRWARPCASAVREEGRRAAEEGRRRGLRGRLRSGAAHGGRFAAQRSPLVLGTAAAALGRAAAACGGRAARQHGRLPNSRNRRVRGRFACAKRSAATAVQRRRTAKFLGSARQKCGYYGVKLAEVPIATALVGGPLGGSPQQSSAAARNPRHPQSPHASASRSFNGVDKSKQYGFRSSSKSGDCGCLPDAVPCWGRAKRY